jgi:hypothetical protein
MTGNPNGRIWPIRWRRGAKNEGADSGLNNLRADRELVSRKERKEKEAEISMWGALGVSGDSISGITQR